MTFNSITFLRVPFDSTYRNIYRFPDITSAYPQNIYNRFIRDFDFYVYNLSNKSFKITNNRITIPVVNAGQSEDIANYYNVSKYNYCAINTSSGIKFYFITHYSTLNQNTFNGSIEITIEYDCWLNNIAYFDSTSNASLPQMCVRSHIWDTFLYQGKYYPRNISFPSNGLLYQHKLINTTKRYRILWLRMLLATDKFWIEYIDGFKPLTIYSPNKSNLQLPYVYAPVAVFDTGTKEYVTDGSWTLKVLKGTFQDDYSIGCFEFLLNKTGIIVSADFTYYPPFTYYQDGSNKRFIIENSQNVEWKMLQTKLTVNDTVSYEPVYSFYYNYGDIKQTSSGVLCSTSLSNANQFYYQTDIEIPSMTAKQYSDGKLPQELQYPFIYYTVDIGGDSTQLVIPEGCVKFSFITKTLNESTVWYVDYYDDTGAVIYQTKEIPIPYFGSIPIATDSESLFYRNQGSQFKAQQDISTTKYVVNTIKGAYNTGAGIGVAAAGASTGNIGMAVSGMNQGTNGIFGMVDASVTAYAENKMFSAKQEDLQNMADYVAFSSANCLDSVYHQNVALLYSHEAVNDTAYRSLVNEINRYGVPVNKQNSMFVFDHDIFNYKQFVNTQFPFITNAQERFTLESVFNRGVTVWNYTVTGDPYYVSVAKSTMNPNDVSNVISED